MTAIILLALAGLYAQDVPPPAQAAVVEEPLEGFWPTERMTEMALKRWASDAADRHQLDEAQHTALKEMLLARWPKFMKENRRRLQPVINRFIESRMDPDPPELDAVQDWAKNALPIYKDARTLIGELNDEFAETLRPEQFAKFEGDIKMMGMFMDGFGERLARWEQGEFEEDEFTGRNSRRGRRERNREARREAAELAAREAAEPTDQILAELDKWDQYLEEFVRRFGLDEPQRVAARSIRKELGERALAHRERHMGEIIALERHMSAEEATEEEITAALTNLYGPIDQLFREFELRLDRLPTEAQRANEAAASSKMPAPEPEANDIEKVQEQGYIESPAGSSP